MSHPSPQSITRTLADLAPGQDLLVTGTRDYFRMSERGACDFVIGARIAGLAEATKHGGYNGEGTPMALRMGSAMEPAINEFLIDQGLELHFIGEEQLEVAMQDPYTIGHPDGLITLTSTAQLSTWAKFNLPKFAQELLEDGEMLLSEIKTMNDESWTAFVKGGLSSHPFLIKYLDQIHGYLGTMRDPGNDELWPDYSRVNPYTGRREFILGSNSFKKLLKERDCDRPTYCLVTGFNTATKQYAFQVIRFDPESFIRRSEEMEVDAQYLHAGQLPPPTYDGRAQSCYFCPFQNFCPSIIKIKEEEGLNLLNFDAPEMADRPDLEELDTLAEEYVELRNNIKALARRSKEIREYFKERLLSGDKITTAAHRLNKTSIPGRKVVDMAVLKEIAEELDFEIPMKRGASYDRLYVQPLFGPTFKDDDRDE